MTRDVIQIDKQGKYTVYANHGVIVCNCPMWDAASIQYVIEPGDRMAGCCDHTWKSIKGKRDVDEYVGVLPRDEVYVPIFFGREGKRSGLWVYVDATTEVSGMLPVTYMSTQPQIEKFPNPSEDFIAMVRRPITWIEPHEGRWNIRGATLEWLRGIYYNLPRCGFTYHSSHLFSPSERKLKNVDSREPDVLVSVMSMLEKGICSTCAAAGADPTVVDDLIPDV